MEMEKVSGARPDLPKEKTPHDIEKLIADVKSFAASLKEKAAEQYEKEFSDDLKAKRRATSDLEREFGHAVADAEEDLVDAMLEYNKRLAKIQKREYSAWDRENQTIKTEVASEEVFNVALGEAEEFFRESVKAIKQKVENRLLPPSKRDLKENLED